MSLSRRNGKCRASRAGNSSRAGATIPEWIHGNCSNIDSDAGSESDIISSDNEPQKYDDLPAEDAHSVLSFSISHAQARVTLPFSSAADQGAVLDSVEGDGIIGDCDGDGDGDPGRKSGEGNLAEPSMRHPFLQSSKDGGMGQLPSPWQATPRVFQRSDVTKSALRDVTSSARPRASSGPIERGSWKIFPFTLPPMPSLPSLQKSPSFPSLSFHTSKSRSPRKKSRISSKTSHGNKDQGSQPGPGSPGSSQFTVGTIKRLSWSIGPTRQTKPLEGLYTRHQVTRSFSQLPSQGDPLALNSQLEPSHSTHPFVDRASLLRRVASDQSLDLRRSLSGVSSLGDDARFESVQSQVNSRFKAIRDSFQDSSIATLAFNPMKRLELQALSYSPRDLKGLATNTGNLSTGTISSRTTVGQPESCNIQTSSDSPTRQAKPPITWLPQALDKLTGDVVIMGGYRGSVLRSAKYHHRQVWIPIKVGLNLRKVDLEVGLEPEDEEMMEETIIPSGMLTHIGPIDISRRLIKRLQKCENALNGKLRIWEYGYDWRLSPHLLSRKLLAFLKELPSNASDVNLKERGALVIAHSLGGLVTRHAVNQCPELFSGVIYAGTPQSCINILGPFRNGDDVLLSSRVLTAQVNFTLRTSFVLLPEDGKCFIDKTTKKEYPVDFFNADSWIQYRFSPCIAPTLPPLDHPVSGLGGLVGSISGGFSSLPLLKSRAYSLTDKVDMPTPNTSSVARDTHTVNALEKANDRVDGTPAPHLGSQTHSVSMDGPGDTAGGPSNITIRPEDALVYLRRTLAETKRFKTELQFQPKHASNNFYPPFAVIYGKSLPTVNGVKVLGRDGIRRADAYENLVFASGDGVCLAKKAMLPEGYGIVRNGRVSSDRSHITLLGDLEGMGKCICAVLEGRKTGIGLGFSGPVV